MFVANVSLYAGDEAETNETLNAYGYGPQAFGKFPLFMEQVGDNAQQCACRLHL